MVPWARPRDQEQGLCKDDIFRARWETIKWPTKDDIVDVDIKAIICEMTVQNVDRIDEKFINGSY